MTFHMEQTQLKSMSDRHVNYEEDPRETQRGPGTPPGSRTGSSIEDLHTSPPQKRMPFPRRLWDAINDSDQMVMWTADGRGVLVNEIRFEQEVMSLYPGLVQVPKFNNLRRQLRAYNFQWRILDNTDYTENLLFSHPCFQRGHPEMLPYVFTRRHISKLTKRRRGKSSYGNMLDDTCTDDDQPEGILPQHSPSTSALGVCGQSSPKNDRRRYRRRKPSRTKANQHIPDSEELNFSTSAHDEENSIKARSTSESNERSCQNTPETNITQKSTKKLCQKSTDGKSTSLSTERPCQKCAEVKSTCNSCEKPCEEDVVFRCDMRNYTCECMSSSNQGKGDSIGKGGPIHFKNCSLSECCNHICGHCNASWVSKPSNELPSQHLPYYYYFQHHPRVNYRAPQEKYMAPMMPPISPQYVMDANIRNTPRSGQPTPLQPMRPADQAVSHATHTNQKVSDTKTMSSSSSQGPDQECWTTPKTYHRLETVPDAMSWQTANMYNKTYRNFEPTQKSSRYEKPDSPWCWNFAPESHVYQIPPKQSANNYYGPAQTCSLPGKTVASSKVPETVKSQKLKCIPQALQVKSTMPMQCDQHVESNAGLFNTNYLFKGNVCPMSQLEIIWKVSMTVNNRCNKEWEMLTSFRS